MDTRYASRKFILTAFLLLVAVVLLVTKIIDQETWSGFSTWVLGLYVTGNVGTYFVARLNGLNIPPE